MSTEFEWAGRLRALLGVPPSAALVVPNGDDAAVLRVEGHLVVTTDALVQGVDFGPWAPWDAVGRKSLAANLSDLAAMGARPLGYLLALCLPRNFPDDALERLGEGMAALAVECGAPCVGGDLSGTAGPVVLTVTALGTVLPGRALQRAGARPGDALYVSGRLGGAAAGLALLQDEGLPAASLEEALARWPAGPLRDAVAAQLSPVPRLALGARLAGVATAGMDITDGLAQDLAHLLTASGVGAVLDGPLPAHPGVSVAAERLGADRAAWTLAGGEEFELLFTASAAEAVDAAARDSGTPVHRVGYITSERMLVLPDGHVLDPEQVRGLDAGRPPLQAAWLRGFGHFA